MIKIGIYNKNSSSVGLVISNSITFVDHKNAWHDFEYIKQIYDLIN